MVVCDTVVVVVGLDAAVVVVFGDVFAEVGGSGSVSTRTTLVLILLRSTRSTGRLRPFPRLPFRFCFLILRG